MACSNSNFYSNTSKIVSYYPQRHELVSLTDDIVVVCTVNVIWSKKSFVTT